MSELSPRWTKDILLRCSSRELLVVVAAYGTLAVAKRMGYRDIEEFITENTDVPVAHGVRRLFNKFRSSRHRFVTATATKQFQSVQQPEKGELLPLSRTTPNP